MKKQIIGFIKKRWLLVWITAALIGAMCFAAYAEYGADSYMKRVVVASADQGMMFSSNYLVEGGANTYQAKSESESNTREYDVNVYLWNYSLKNPAQCYPDAIDYTVELRITDIKGNPITDASVFDTIDSENTDNNVYRSIIVKKSDGTTITTKQTYNSSSDLSSSFTFTDSIAAGNGASRQTHYIITFRNWDLNTDKNICVQMIVKPDATKYKELRNIGAVIGLKEMTGEVSNDWKASISELPNNSSSDGYNLVLSGSGTAAIEIKWNTQKIDINRYILSGESVYKFYDGERTVSETDANGWRTLTISADSNNYRNRYNIQLYFCGAEKPADTFFAKAGTPEAANAWITYGITQT